MRTSLTLNWHNLFLTGIFLGTFEVRTKKTRALATMLPISLLFATLVVLSSATLNLRPIIGIVCTAHRLE